MLPEFNDGVLPEGIHDCTLEEVAGRFGRIQRSDRRPRLMENLRNYVAELKAAGIALALIIDGSFVTSKDEPGDMDLLLVLHDGFDLTEDVKPSDYNLQSKRFVKKRYEFEVFPVRSASREYDSLLDLFLSVKPGDPDFTTSHERKGVLRVAL